MGPFSILLCLTPDKFTCQCEKARRERVKRPTHWERVEKIVFNPFPMGLPHGRVKSSGIRQSKNTLSVKLYLHFHPLLFQLQVFDFLPIAELPKKVKTFDMLGVKKIPTWSNYRFVSKLPFLHPYIDLHAQSVCAIRTRGFKRSRMIKGWRQTCQHISCFVACFYLAFFYRGTYVNKFEQNSS